MKDDPTIARIRKARHEFSARFDHDPKKGVEYLIRLQKRREAQIGAPVRQSRKPSSRVHGRSGK